MALLSMGNDVCVIIRYFNRVQDCLVNLDIIKNNWKCPGLSYFKIVITNNKESLGEISQARDKYDLLVCLKENRGHIAGDSTLLRSCLEHIPDRCGYAVLLTADTWLLSDGIIKKYIGRMEKDPALVWSGSNWIDKYHSLAVDFALARTGFLKENPSLFEFDASDTAECRLASYIRAKGMKYCLMNERFPVHLPKTVPRALGWETFGRRRHVFPRVPMVTHHIEDYGNSMGRKKLLANRASGENVFEDAACPGFGLYYWRYLYIGYEFLLFAMTRPFNLIRRHHGKYRGNSLFSERFPGSKELL